MPSHRYYTPYEVAQHNSPDDCWVSVLGDVLDLTSLTKTASGPTIEPILRAAGTDISHWFDVHTGEVKTQVDPISNLLRPYCPQGLFLHVPPVESTSNWDMSFGTPWWKDEQLQKGKLSKRCRMIRVKNVLTKQEDHMEVPSEETIAEIRARYMALNSHAMAYTWKAFKPEPGRGFELFELDMNHTLEQNGIEDETAIFDDYMVESDFFIPVLHLYWSDDLTVA